MLLIYRPLFRELVVVYARQLRTESLAIAGNTGGWLLSAAVTCLAWAIATVMPQDQHRSDTRLPVTLGGKRRD